MSAHQTITGALNRGEHVYAVGSIDGINFTVCAVGADIVILAPNFDRVQVIPGIGQNGGNIVSSVSSCQDSGRIAATYGNVIRIFEPSHYDVAKSKHRLDYRWFETESLTVKGPVSSVLWNFEGLRLLVVVRNELLLYQHQSLQKSSSSRNSTGRVMFSIAEDERLKSSSCWNCVWNMKLAHEPRYIRYSPDGLLIATAGENDCIVKIWYENQDQAPDADVSFSFVSLLHPAAVKGFEWRKVGRYLPRKCIANVLITYCDDNTSRIWKETPSTDHYAVDIAGDTHEAQLPLHNYRKHKHFNVKKAKHKLVSKLKQFGAEKRKRSDDNASPQGTISAAPSTETISHASSVNSGSGPEVRFHLAATINADSDCLLVPTIKSSFALQKPFAVHWLNNKELVFTKGVEKLLAETLLEGFEERRQSPETEPSETLSETTNPEIITPQDPPFTFTSYPPVNVTINGAGATLSESISTKDPMDVKLEVLMRQWLKSYDVLFTIHPVDGSLLTWTIEWLDDLYRQPVISFASRFPGALPLTDAASLQTSLSTFNPHDPVYVEVLQHHGYELQDSSSLLSRLPSPAIYMLTNHENGSLNLWQLAMDDTSDYTAILNISHLSRMCGHRFQISQVVPHPVLPLMITTSQFTATEHVGENERKDTLSEIILWKINPVGPLCRSGGVSELARMAAHSSDSFKHIAWVPAILPSTTLGTICNSPSSCFVATCGTNLVLYQAVVDARSLLAEIYDAKKAREDSPERVFSRNSNSLSPSPLPSQQNSVLDTFNIISTQSAAKPGCVIEVSSFQNVIQPNSSLLLLHVFSETLLLEDENNSLYDTMGNISMVNDRTRAPTFSDTYYVVLISKDGNSDRFVMYTVELSTQAPVTLPITDTDNVPDSKGFLRPASPCPPSVARLQTSYTLACDQELPLPSGVRVVHATLSAGHLSSSSLYPACKAPYVLLTSCDDDIIRFWKCSRVKNQFGANQFEWREWGMVSDCRRSMLELEGSIFALSAAHSGRIACAYDSRVGVPTTEKPTKIDIGIFECESSGGVEWMREDTIVVKDIVFPQVRLPRIEEFSSTCRGMLEVAKAELATALHHSASHSSLLQTCGVVFSKAPSMARLSASRQNLQLDAGQQSPPVSKFSTLHADGTIKRVLSSSTIKAQEAFDNLTLSDMIMIDWISTEDGGHILTVAVAANIYLYTQVSQDEAQRNVVAMRDSEVSLRRPSLRKASSLAAPEHMHNKLTRWVCIRVVELQSADGLPPIPTTLHWVRDGLLIVGMQSEMRCYNQWNLRPTQEQKQTAPLQHKFTRKANVGTSLAISPSHSMLDQLGKKAKESERGFKSKLVADVLKSNAVASNAEAQFPDPFLSSVTGLGLFEFSRFASPILPQYHPKQLIVLLNAGRTKRVKAILLHVLKSLKQRQALEPLARAASIRRMSTIDVPIIDDLKGGSEAPKITVDETPDYDEVDDITPLPLYALVAADIADDSQTSGEKAEHIQSNGAYDTLFNDDDSKDEGNLDDLLQEDEDEENDADTGTELLNDASPIAFSAKHNRMLTELLTHAHLPGLSSVDQMHLLAIADTLSHFSPDVMDKLARANASTTTPSRSVLGECSEAGGYAAAAGGVDTVDECGLRFLMAMKQYEYLLLCLPIMQRQQLKLKGISSAHIIWAQHSETETELLNAIPYMHKQNPTWEEVRSLGAAWWMRSTASLKVCIEKLAKAAYQQNQDPMDASLFYLALRKKNVLTHLFKSARNTTMSEFFMNDFSDSFWQRAAMKNAFVLMGKQRFAHAAALFLLANCLKDAIQTILHKLGDLQLAMVVLRLYEQDPEKQQSMLKEILCREVLGQSIEEFEAIRGKTDEDAILPRGASSDPFERSMAYWVLKDYARAAYTLVDEAASGRIDVHRQEQFNLSNIFNFYSYLRKHPLVIRQKLTDAGTQVGSTEKYLAFARQMEVLVTPAERRLFFRTAAEHMAHGCPMLALDVLSRLPKNIQISFSEIDSIKALLADEMTPATLPTAPQTVDAFDWSKPSNVVAEDELQLDWGDDDEHEDGEEDKQSQNDEPTIASELTQPLEVDVNAAAKPNATEGPVDIIAQQLRFVACLRILTEELSTLASGYAVDGGHLRYQLFIWLEREVEVLTQLCDYRTSEDHLETDILDEDFEVVTSRSASPMPMHEAIKNDRAELNNRLKLVSKRRRWLASNQKLLRSFTSYCQLHMAQNHRLASALMELLLLLLEIQKDVSFNNLIDLPDSSAFPLLISSIAPQRMFVTSPYAFIETQCHDLLASIADLIEVPQFKENLLIKYSQIYGISLGLSSCLYQSLSDVDTFNIPTFFRSASSSSGILTRRTRQLSMIEDIRVSTAPARWPGVDTLVALLGREKDEEAPHLRLLLAECFIAIIMSLFTYAFASYDARWLYRLAGHAIGPRQFAAIFGGGGEKRLKTIPSARPPRPAPPQIDRGSSEGPVSEPTTLDSTSLRAKLNAKVFGSEKAMARTPSQASVTPIIEQTVLKWVPPNKSVVQMFAEKPQYAAVHDFGVEYDSDDEDEQHNQVDDDDEIICEAANPSSYAWSIIRLAMVEQMIDRFKQFLLLAGFDPADVPSNAPRIAAALRVLNNWSVDLRNALHEFEGGCPDDFLPSKSSDSNDHSSEILEQKCKILKGTDNTPFESEDPRALPLKRLWTYLVQQDNLANVFIRFIFGNHPDDDTREHNDTVSTNVHDHGVQLPETFKILQKDQDPIVTFCLNPVKPGWIVLSTGRELQEMDISPLYDTVNNNASWLHNRTELDVSLLSVKRDALRDNDDYQLFGSDNSRAGNLNLIFKRTINGIRRMDNHPTAPFYLTGATDGSIRVWEWGVGQPVYTARVAGQHAKVTKIHFSSNGNKFVASDGDGMMYLWVLGQQNSQKSYFSTKCHTRTTTDVHFLGHSSSLLLTAGSSSLDANLCLWDTLMPTSKSCVQTWNCHPDGANCAIYLPAQHTIVSGGKFGELCFWDIRTHAMRCSFKAFEPHLVVKSLSVDPTQDFLCVGSTEGDMKIISADSTPQVLLNLPGEHIAKSGFSFRQVGSGNVQGVQQMFIDNNQHLFSCGADCSLKLRTLPSISSMMN